MNRSESNTMQRNIRNNLQGAYSVLGQVQEDLNKNIYLMNISIFQSKPIVTLVEILSKIENLCIRLACTPYTFVINYRIQIENCLRIIYKYKLKYMIFFMKFKTKEIKNFMNENFKTKRKDRRKRPRKGRRRTNTRLY
jgi:hypothetical protein